MDREEDSLHSCRLLMASVPRDLTLLHPRGLKEQECQHQDSGHGLQGSRELHLFKYLGRFPVFSNLRSQQPKTSHAPIASRFEKLCILLGAVHS